jgi:hypothetical protein
MQYMLLAYVDPQGFAALKPEDAQKAVAAYTAYGEALRKEGVIVGSNRLRPAGDATLVRIANGRTSALNGPYAETKEQLGGYFLIDVPDLDAALSWAARCPAASHGSVEVRPVWAM